ncbi:hypothetical protein ALP45_200098 [Pseudomonas coronafaciens pv. atropurpurea]|nr:hypothetical protein ALP45_200098 [Pseudomonas coronafaciens pv. atropurpurea]
MPYQNKIKFPIFSTPSIAIFNMNDLSLSIDIIKNLYLCSVNH